jgi:hypothetical protein
MDTDLLALCKRHDALWAQLNTAVEPSGWLELSREADQIERRVVGIPATTRKGLAGKRRVLRRADFSDDDGVIESTLLFDRQRVEALRAS